MKTSRNLCERCVLCWIKYTFAKTDHVRLVKARENEPALDLEAERQAAAARLETVSLHIREHLAEAHGEQPRVMKTGA
jgi:hypothetical protein